MAKLFVVTVGQIVHYEGEIFKDIAITGKTENEKLKRIEQLDEKDRKAIFHINYEMGTKSEFKEFLRKILLHLKI